MQNKHPKVLPTFMIIIFALLFPLLANTKQSLMNVLFASQEKRIGPVQEVQLWQTENDSAVHTGVMPIVANDYSKQREKMVKTQIEGRGVKHQATLNSMKMVERHRFIPKNIESHAYADRPLPIGYGQTISQPYIVAYMTEKLEPKVEETVLEIGTGSGYQAAVLANIVKEVYTIEIVPELGKTAKERLKVLGYDNVHVKAADGYFGWNEHAPFDNIIVTCAAGYIPPPLIKQLKDGGKMIIPVGTPFSIQWLMMVEKNGKDIITRKLIPVRFVPFRRSK